MIIIFVEYIDQLIDYSINRASLNENELFPIRVPFLFGFIYY